MALNHGEPCVSCILLSNCWVKYRCSNWSWIIHRGLWVILGMEIPKGESYDTVDQAALIILVANSRVLVQVLAILLPVQLASNVLGEAMDDGSSTWAHATQVWDWDEDSGTWLDLADTEWNREGRSVCLSFSVFLLSLILHLSNHSSIFQSVLKKKWKSPKGKSQDIWTRICYMLICPSSSNMITTGLLDCEVWWLALFWHFHSNIILPSILSGGLPCAAYIPSSSGSPPNLPISVLIWLEVVDPRITIAGEITRFTLPTVGFHLLDLSVSLMHGYDSCQLVTGSLGLWLLPVKKSFIVPMVTELWGLALGVFISTWGFYQHKGGLIWKRS